MTPEIFVIVVVISTIAALFLDIFYLKRLKHLWRMAIMVTIIAFCPIILSLGVETFVDKDKPQAEFASITLLVLVFGGLVIMLNAVGNYVYKVFWKKVLQKKYANLPDDSPQKEALEKLIDQIDR